MRVHNVRKSYNLIVEKCRESRNGNLYLKVQLDQSLLKNPSRAEADPYLVSRTVQKVNADKTVDRRVIHVAQYRKEQWADMVKASGQDPIAWNGHEIIGLNAFIVPIPMGGTMAMIDTTKRMSPTHNMQFGRATMEKQADVTRQAKKMERIMPRNEAKSTFQKTGTVFEKF